MPGCRALKDRAVYAILEDRLFRSRSENAGARNPETKSIRRDAPHGGREGAGKGGGHPETISLSYVEICPNNGGKVNDQELQADLYQQIGKLQMELEWLKKKVGDGR